MFHNIPESILARMRHLEAIDQRDQADGTPRLQRLRQVSPEVGRFIALMAAMAPAGQYIEIDTDKDLYAPCYEIVVPRLVPGGILVADNAINRAALLQPMLDRALQDERVDAQIVPVGKGALVCRKR
jgi:predicted O-methyltransferase YrrM